MGEETEVDPVEARRQDRIMHRAFLDQNVAEARRGLAECADEDYVHLMLVHSIIEAAEFTGTAIMLAEALIALAKGER